MNEEINEPVMLEKKNEEESPLSDELKKPSETREVEQIVVTKYSFWEHFLLKLSVEEKAVIAENIILEMGNKPLYWVELIISVMIATFGLLQNSVAIIIGAMLIAPLLRPIKGFAFGITTGQPNYFWMALKMLLASIVIAVLTSYVVSLMIPIKIETPEILARISPNLLDLLIAIAAGIIAILALYFKKLSENIAGVAMAAAILPPLAVTGIELAFHNNNAMFGSFFLFLTNLFAILAVGVIIFLLYGFFPAHKDFKQRAVRIGAILFMLLIFISFPLSSSLSNIALKTQFQSQALVILNESLKRDFPLVKLANISVLNFDEEVVEFSGKLKIPLGMDFAIEDYDIIRQKMAEKFGREVNLEFEVIPIVSVRD